MRTLEDNQDLVVVDIFPMRISFCHVAEQCAVVSRLFIDQKR